MTTSRGRARQASPAKTAARSSDAGAAGAEALAVAPPSYGIDFVDRGMPAQLLAGAERLSGLDLSGVRVHANSAEPSRIGALAFARGSDIHLAPGQERHLPHEAWHVVQQRQGRVRANLRMMGMQLNHDAALEREADTMGAKSLAAGAAPGNAARSADAPPAGGATESAGAAQSRPSESAPVAQALFGIEIEANIPVYAAQGDWTDLGDAGATEVLAFLKGWTSAVAYPVLHEGGIGDPRPYSMTIDKGGPTEDCIKALLKDWEAKAAANKARLTPVRSKPKKTEYVTEPYSERYTYAADQHRQPGLFAFFRDLKVMQEQIQADLATARGGGRVITAEGVYGAPSLAAWQAAAQYFALPNHAQEAQAAFDAVAASIEDELYVQSTLGVLPEAVAGLYAQEQTTAENQFPLSRGAIDWNAASTDTPAKEDAAILGAMEISALAKARALAATLAEVNDEDRETFAGYMATVLIEMGGEAIMVGGKKSGGVLKNVSSLLSKTSLVDYQAQLPAPVKAKLAHAQTRAGLVAESIVWLRAIVAASNTKIDEESGEDRADTQANEKRLKHVVVPDRGPDPHEDAEEDEDDLAEGTGVSYRRFENRIREVLAGTRDRLYETQLRDQESGLDAEDPAKGAATGRRALDEDGTRSRAIPFELRAPGATNRMASAALGNFAQAVITRLRAVNDPLDDRTPQREAILAGQRRAEEAAAPRAAADNVAAQLVTTAMQDDTLIGPADASVLARAAALQRSASLGTILSNIVAAFRNALNAGAEQQAFDASVADRYGTDYGGYLTSAHSGQLPFMALNGERTWLRAQHEAATSAAYPLAAPQKFVAPEKELPVARAAANLSLELKTQAALYAAALGARGREFWQWKTLEPFGNDLTIYVGNHVRAMDFSADVQTVTQDMTDFRVATLARLQKSHGARLKGQQVANAIEAHEAQRHATMGVKQAAFRAATAARYPRGIHDYVAAQPVDLNSALLAIQGGLDTLLQTEQQAIDAIVV